MQRRGLLVLEGTQTAKEVKMSTTTNSTEYPSCEVGKEVLTSICM